LLEQADGASELDEFARLTPSATESENVRSAYVERHLGQVTKLVPMACRKLSTLFLLVISAPLIAQDTTSREAFPLVSVGTVEDNYLRYLQSIGEVPEYPWSIRGFGPQEARSLAADARGHPSFPGLSEVRQSTFSAQLLPVEGTVRFNSAFPYGSNDGAIWAGRGFTPAVAGGFVAMAGPISLVLDPVAFVAQNEKFTLMPNGSTGVAAFWNGIFPGAIDLPQRFGDKSYGRIDWGQSTLRADLFGVTAGISNANMGWGPMQTYEYILSGNAPGFAHVFAGTARPANLWLAHVHLRAIWGRLEQSDYSPVQGTKYYSSRLETGTQRFATGLVVVIQPRWIPGLELGGGRFFHSLWPREGIPRSYITKPLQAIYKVNVPASPGLPDTQGGGDNQEASAFARWVFPKSGFEMYGEYGHEDHSYDRRDLIQEPDHTRSYGLGLRKVMGVDSAGLSAIRVESINFQLPTLARNRGEGSTYAHGVIAQGHTNRGQFLGADVGVGTGAGFTFAWDRFSEHGRSTYTVTRTVRQEDGTFYVTGVQNPRSSDVQIGLGAERVRYLAHLELSTGATLIRELNRDFRTNTWNLNAIVGIRYHRGK
jgi:hypothetical protein